MLRAAAALAEDTRPPEAQYNLALLCEAAGLKQETSPA